MLKGLPASLKTTWAKERLKRGGCNRISMDDIRDSVLGGWSEKKERLALQMRDEMIKATIRQGRDAIVDATNLNPVHERRLRALAEKIGARFEVEDSFLSASPEECIERDLHRGDKAVGAKVIYDMYHKWVRPKPDKVLEKSNKRRCILCDLDGCLARNNGRDWDDLTRVEEDSVNPLISFLIDCVNEAGDFYADIILITGRDESCREATERWLDKNCIQYEKLLMRAEGDERRNEDVKEDLYIKYVEPYYAVAGVIDDNLNCISMWRGFGFNTLCSGDMNYNI